MDIFNMPDAVSFDPECELFIGISCENKVNYTVFTSSDQLEWREIQKFTIPGITGDVDIFDFRGEDGGKWVIYSGGRYVTCDFDAEKGFFGFSMTGAVCFGVPFPLSGFLMELAGDSLRFKVAIPEGGTVGEAHVEADLPSHGISRAVSVPSAVTLTLAKLEEAVTVDFCGFSLTLDPMSNRITADCGTMPLCADDGGVTVMLFAAYDPISGSEYVEVCTGIEDGHAKAVGNFKTKFVGDRLTLRGEGALTELTIRQLNPEFYYVTEF